MELIIKKFGNLKRKINEKLSLNIAALILVVIIILLSTMT